MSRQPFVFRRPDPAPLSALRPPVFVLNVLGVRSILTASVLIAASLISICVRCGDGAITAPKLSRSLLMDAASAGGDYLVRIQRTDGSFYYYYDAAADRFESRRYNIVRHAGTALALFDLYAATRDVRYLESARGAMRFLTRRFHAARGDALYVLDFDGKAKLGASGLALVALARHIELDPKTAKSRDATRLANLIMKLQRKDGSFAMRYRLRTTEPEAPQSLYYPGEAMLGLIRLFRLNGDKRLFEAARRGADYQIESQLNMGLMPADAWLMQALEALYNIGHEQRYAQHTIALAEAMIADQYTDSDAEGYAGGFGPGPPRTTPAASRAEGLICAYRIARSTGDARAPSIATALEACARFQLVQQFTLADSARLPNPRRAAGGFRESPSSMNIRIDYVQHNISSLLGTAAVLY